MIRIETENPRHLPRVSMRDVWFSRRVHPEGLEPSTNGLRGHCSSDLATGAYSKSILRFGDNKNFKKSNNISCD